MPRFRTDLTVSRHATTDGAVFVIKDPRREKFYRLPEEALFIAGQLDGETALETVRQRTEAHFHTPLPAETLRGFVRHLDTAGLLERDATKAGAPLPSAARGASRAICSPCASGSSIPTGCSAASSVWCGFSSRHIFSRFRPPSSSPPLASL
ncbi:MAG: hypothetical protein HY736_15510 [Verrucomicrobia bacterium]|nr:hypothetical protein [Verrucomicrobiota bacterium]